MVVRILQEEQEMLTVADYIEYVAEKREERAEDKIKKTIVTNMLRQGKNEKDIQATLDISTDEVRKLIHDVQTNAQSWTTGWFCDTTVEFAKLAGSGQAAIKLLI